MNTQPFIGIICDASFSALAARLKSAGYRIARVPPRMLVPGSLPPVDIWALDCNDTDLVADALEWMTAPIVALSNRPDNADREAYRHWCEQIIKALDKWTANSWQGQDQSSASCPEQVKAVEGVWVLIGSRGAEAAAAEFFSAMPWMPPVAFIYAQHRYDDKPELVEQLNTAHDHLQCRLALGRHWLNPGQMLVAPATCRLQFGQRGEVFSLRESWGGDGGPKIDQLIGDMSGMQPTPSGVIVLSGTSCDGLQGALGLRALGAHVWGQDPESARRPALPLAAKKLRIATHIASPAKLARDFLSLYPQAKTANFQGRRPCPG